MWVHIHEVEVKAFLGRELKKDEVIRFKDKNSGNLKLENLEVYDAQTKSVIDVKTEAEVSK